MGAERPPTECCPGGSPHEAYCRQQRLFAGLWGWAAFCVMAVVWMLDSGCR